METKQHHTSLPVPEVSRDRSMQYISLNIVPYLREENLVGRNLANFLGNSQNSLKLLLAKISFVKVA